MAFSPLATYAFVGTNYDKVASGDWTRYPVLVGQIANAAQATAETAAKHRTEAALVVNKANSIFLDTAKSDKVVNGFSKAITFFKNKIYQPVSKWAKSDKAFNGLTKTVKFAQNNINPLIVASGATKVVLAKKEDREKTLFSEGAMILGMFAGEGWMKKNLDTKVLSKLPIDKKWAPIVKGILFVAGSITASTIGQKIGEALFAKLDKSRHQNPTAQQVPNIQTNMKAYRPMEIKA